MTLFKSTLIVVSLLLTNQTFAEGDHSHDFPKEIMEFHHVMAPLWHMDEGSERTKLSCEATDKMLALTKKIAHSESLASAVTNMQKTCKSSNSDIQQDFKNIHDAFHKVSEHTK